MEWELKTKRCKECGDDIPYYTRICPFCYYANQEGHYDHDSSPYLMMMDLKSITKELIELRKISLMHGVARWMFRREIDPNWREVLEIEATFETICGNVEHRYGRMRTVIESLETFNDIVSEALAKREQRVKHIRYVGRGVTLYIVTAMITTLLYIFIMRQPI